MELPIYLLHQIKEGNTVFRGVKSKGYPHPPPPPNSHTALHTDWRPLHTHQQEALDNHFNSKVVNHGQQLPVHEVLHIY